MAARKPLVINADGRKAQLPSGDTIQGTASAATTLETGRTIGMTGDVSWTSSAFNGSDNVTGTSTLANSGVPAGTYNNSATQTQSFTVDVKGRITGVGTATTITPAWDSIASKPTTLSGYGITDAQTFDADLTAIAGLEGAAGLLRKTDTNTWALDTNPYLIGNQTITLSGDLTGSGTTSITTTLSNSGVTAGTYNNSATQTQSFTVNAKGRITGTGSLTTITPAWSSISSKPTTLSGYGITDAQPVDADLTSIAGLAGTSGLLRKTAENTWTLDSALPTSYLPKQTLENGLFEVYENIATYSSETSSLTGTCKITLPYGWNTTMLSFIIEGYNYASGRGYWRAEVSGYNYTNQWYYTTRMIYGNPPFGSEIRLGYDSILSKCVILLGNTSTTWNYTKLVVSRVYVGHSGVSSDWSTGWTIELITDEANIINIVTTTLHGILGNAETATTLATGRTIGMTGDVAWTSASFDGSGNVTGTSTLANSGVTAGTYNNSATKTQSFTVDAKGRVTGTGTATTITPAWSSITSKPTTLEGAGITSGSLTGDLSFGSSVRQMINLYSTTFAIGVQNNTLYHRTNETNGGYAWFQGGIHSSTQNDAGEGGTVLAKIDSSGNILSTQGLYAHGTAFSSLTGSNFSWTSSATSGIVYGVYNVNVIDPGTSLAANTAMYGTRSTVVNKITNTQAGSYTVSLYGAYNHVQSSDTAGENRKLNIGIGSYNQATANSTGSTAGTLYGTDSFAIVYDSSSTTTVKGLLARIQGGSTAAGGSTITTATSVDSLITNYTASTITTAYLYKGDYANTGTITNKWGLYLTDEGSNYCSGDLGLGTTTLSARLHAVKTTEQLRLGYDATKYVSHTVDSSGNVLIDAVGNTKIGDGTNYTQFATDGTMTLVGTATVFDDLLIEMKESLRGSQTKPDWDSTNFGLLFPRNDTSEYIVFNVQMPHRWKEGTTIYPHVHFFQDQNVTPTFKIDYRWVNIGASVPSFTTGYTMSTIVGSQTWTTGMLHRVVGNSTGISGSGKTISSMLQIKLYRDDNTYSGDCLVVSFDIHYEIDGLGSSLEYTK